MIKPIYVIREAAVSDKQMSYVVSAIEAFLKLLSVLKLVPVIQTDVIVESGRILSPYLSEASFGSPPKIMVDSNLLASLIEDDSCKRGSLSDPKPYYVVVVNRDLRWDSKDPSRIYGLGSHAHSAIITVRDYFSKTRLANDTEERIKNTTIHELGHMFGLIPGTRVADVIVGKYGKHCANKCIMQSRAEPATGLVGIELDSALCKSFCLRCFVHLIVEGWKIRSDHR